MNTGPGLKRTNTMCCGFAVFYSSIVSHSMSEKTVFEAHGKQSKQYIKVKRFQMLFILRFKVKSCLKLCRSIIGSELAAEITQQN